jgi:hypothetical protein
LLENTPTFNAVKIADGLDLREGEKLRPVNSQGVFDITIYSESPILLVNIR